MNKQIFDLSKKNGLKYFNAQLQLLIDYNKDTENEEYYDIHILPLDNELISLEYEKTPWNKDWGGKFEWVEYSEAVYEEVYFPDHHFEMVPKGSANDVLKEWHKDNPNWVLTSYGTWTNTEENRLFTIEHSIEEWRDRQEKVDDSTFSLGIFKKKEEDTFGVFINCPPDDVLKRISYVVIGEEITQFLADDASHPIPFDENLTLGKIGTYDLCLVDNKVDVYYSDKLTNQILFVTDSNYLIYKLEIEKQEKNNE